MRETSANKAPIDTEESVLLMLTAPSMISPATPAYKYVIRQACMLIPQGKD